MNRTERALAWLHRLATNGAVWALVGGISAYWILVFGLGADPARDTIDIGVMVLATWMFFLLLPQAVNRFLRGGGAREWRYLMGCELVVSGIDAQRLWALTVRWEGRPTWMVESPFNGFFAFWILCGLALMIWGYSGNPTLRSRRPSILIVVGVICLIAGVLLAHLLDL